MLQDITSLLAQAKIVNQGTTDTIHALISESASHKAHTVFRPNKKVQQGIHLNCNAAHTSTAPGVVQHTALQTRRRENCWFYIQNLTEAEQKYSTVEKEALVWVWPTYK